jgi:multidrug transporter EmrE-like cation transporter
MGLRVFLAFSGAVWLPYGVFCFFQPTFLAEAAGVTATTTTATIELRAMYGGLQFAIGSLAALAFFREPLRRPALITLAFLCAGLALSRLLGALVDAEVSAYTGSALAFEIASTGLATWFLLRKAEPVADLNFNIDDQEQ